MPKPPSLDYRIEVARLLNREEVSAAPLKRLPIVSIFDDEEYENYDFDLISPQRRLRIAAVLATAGFRQKSGKHFKGPHEGAPVVLPHPAPLGSDPSRPAEELVAVGDAVVLVTPTQAILLYLHRFGGKPKEIAAELAELVWHHPANLDKIRDWAKAAGRADAFAKIRPRLEKAQDEGIALRKKRQFESRLPQ